MARRAIICIATAAVLILAAAGGFIFGTAASRGWEDTQSNQEALVSSSEDSDTVGSETAISSGEESSGSREDSANGDRETLSNSLLNDSSGSEPDTEENSLSDGQNEMADSADNAQDNYEYIILANNGTMVVYYSDASTVYFDSGIKVTSLPDETIDKVVQGIRFQSEEELFAFLESYSS
ncbi:MAG: hypothetical protein LIO37_04150 [Clostridiales bacterium]|nr:hypothetical protein [Clostridiales bacterium]